MPFCHLLINLFTVVINIPDFIVFSGRLLSTQYCKYEYTDTTLQVQYSYTGTPCRIFNGNKITVYLSFISDEHTGTAFTGNCLIATRAPGPAEINLQINQFNG